MLDCYKSFRLVADPKTSYTSPVVLVWKKFHLVKYRSDTGSVMVYTLYIMSHKLISLFF